MRVISLLFAILSAVHVATAQTTPSTVDQLSPEQRAVLESELQSWKASPAGQQAAKDGLTVKPTASIASLTSRTDELQRFLDSKRMVEKLQATQPKAKFSLQTPFALLSTQEFAAFVNKSNVAQQRTLMQSQQTTLPPRQLRTEADIPAEVDWQKAGCVSRVKDQGACGVCWAFSSIGALESGFCATSPTKTLPVLSEQDVVSCGPTKGRCDGGWAYLAYDWIIRMNGGSVCTDAAYPYASWSGASPACTKWDDPNFKCNKPDLGLVSYYGARYYNHPEMEQVVATRPVAAQVKAGLPYFQFYAGGVITGNEEQCPSAYPDHEVTVVGYTNRDGIKVWKFKNSWSAYWGESGFGYIERGFQGATYGACGIETWAYYPIFRSEAPWIETLRCGNMRNGVEIIGQTIKIVYVYDVLSGQCCDACRREPGCKAVTFRDNTCILKGTVESERYDSTFAWTSIMVLPKADANRYMCLPVEDNADYAGNDVSRSLAKDAGECCDKCTLEPNCGAYTWTKWLGGSCFLKYSKTTVVRKPPPADGSPYFRSGELYKCQPLKQNVDFVGEDLMNRPAKTAAECCNICRMNWPCLAFSWSNYQGGTCWLKRKAATSITKAGVISATVY